MANTVATASTEETAGVHNATSPTGRLSQFLHDVRSEMRKVITPSRAEVQSTTTVVIVTVFIFAAFFEAVDFFLGQGIDKIFLHLTKH